MSARQVSYSFLQHWLEYLLAIAAVIGLCFFVVQWAMPGVSKFISANWTWLAVAGILLLFGATSPWTAPAVFRAYRAIRLHKEEVENSRSYRALLQASTQALQNGADLRYKNARTGDEVEVKYPVSRIAPARVQVQQEIETAQQLALSSPQLPTDVDYEDIKHQVPRGHILVGIGRKGIETKERAVGACTWIVGLSGTGKTSTTVLRVDERAADEHKFLGVDPHWFKPDSLTNAIAAYADDFLMPMAQTPEETNKVLHAFLTEFKARRSGQVPQPWQKITLLVDEVGSLMDTTEEDEEENASLLKSIARICGQEARNFNMGGIFISQQATGLSWLRKVALMVIVHQLLQESEKKLATNNDTAVMLDMKTWPIGRTYVFGVGFQEGPRTVQQPRFSVLAVESTTESIEASTAEYEESVRSCDGPHTTTLVEPLDRMLPFDVEKFKQARKMLLEQCTQSSIICTVWDVAENTRAFRTAREELKLMLAYLASMAEV